MNRLFESFSQVDASTSRRYGGTGLGLAISKRIVELMDGTLEAESEEGEGSTFHLELIAPQAEVPRDDRPGRRPAAARRQADSRGRRQRHQPRDREPPDAIVGDGAGGGRARLRSARTASREASASTSRFSTCVMPEMDGLELGQRIRRLRDAQELPLVLLTSLAGLPLARTSADFSAQLVKPVRASQLYNALLTALARGHEPTRHDAPDGGRRPRAATSSLRILLAEDNAVNQKVALRVLERLGYRADVASNGLEALEALERERYDVVLMDVQMPEMDGLEASRRICARWPEASRPRIIAMTANAMIEDREACLAAGMDDYVAKPVRPEELAEALARARAHGRGLSSAAGRVARAQREPRRAPDAVRIVHEIGEPALAGSAGWHDGSARPPGARR